MLQQPQRFYIRSRIPFIDKLQDKVFTEDPKAALMAFKELIQRETLQGTKAEAMLSCDGLLVAKHRFNRPGTAHDWSARLDSIVFSTPKRLHVHHEPTAGSQDSTRMEQGRDESEYVGLTLKDDLLRVARLLGQGDAEKGVLKALLLAEGHHGN